MKILFVLLAIVSAFNYDPSLANELTALSFAAYCHPDDILNWNVGTISQ